MSRILTYIASVVLMLLAAGGSVMQYHHHGHQGRICLCLCAESHSDCEDCHDHNMPGRCEMRQSLPMAAYATERQQIVPSVQLTALLPELPEVPDAVVRAGYAGVAVPPIAVLSAPPGIDGMSRRGPPVENV